MFKDYIPPQAHPRHTYRVNEERVSVNHTLAVKPPRTKPKLEIVTTIKEIAKTIEKPPAIKKKKLEFNQRRRNSIHSMDTVRKARSMRNELGLTYKAIAEELNVPVKTISNWCRNGFRNEI